MFLVPSFFEIQTWEMSLFLFASLLPVGFTGLCALRAVPDLAHSGDQWIKYIGELCREWDFAPTVN